MNHSATLYYKLVLASIKNGDVFLLHTIRISPNKNPFPRDLCGHESTADAHLFSA